MAIVEKSVLIERSAEQMFDLVESIEDYPKFLPWCAKTEVDYRDAVRTVATLHISYLSVRSHFTTENGKDYRAKLALLESGRALGMSGCIAMFCRQQVWQRE